MAIVILLTDKTETKETPMGTAALIVQRFLKLLPGIADRHNCTLSKPTRIEHGSMLELRVYLWLDSACAERYLCSYYFRDAAGGEVEFAVVDQCSYTGEAVPTKAWRVYDDRCYDPELEFGNLVEKIDVADL